MSTRSDTFETWIPPKDSPQARALASVAERSSGPSVDPTLHVTFNFHPDRLHHGTPILESLAKDGIYRSQFETGTSNGGMTAYKGGSRWGWESRIFCGAYDSVSPVERPKYGALNHRRRAVGASPRFGSAHLRLVPAMTQRSSFCYPDSVFEPLHFGVASRMGLIPLAEADERDALDDYIEAHVHGPLRLSCDIEALVLDPCYLGTEIEVLARALPCRLEWHPGFRLHVDQLHRHPTYRGPEYVELGASLAHEGFLTPATIGDAARSGRYEPQDLKKVWHYIARFGEETEVAG